MDVTEKKFVPIRVQSNSTRILEFFHGSKFVSSRSYRSTINITSRHKSNFYADSSIRMQEGRQSEFRQVV